MKYFKQALLLVCSISLALSPVFLIHETWEAFSGPSGFAEILAPTAGVVLAWLGKSPITPNK